MALWVDVRILETTRPCLSREEILASLSLRAFSWVSIFSRISSNLKKHRNEKFISDQIIKNDTEKKNTNEKIKHVTPRSSSIEKNNAIKFFFHLNERLTMLPLTIVNKDKEAMRKILL